MVERHNADLANGLGNLASRVLAMLASNFDGAVPADAAKEAGDLPQVVADVARRYDEAMERVAPTQALAAVWEIVDRANGYLVERAPWALAKDPSKREELEGILAASAEVLRVLAVLISPIMPDAAQRLWTQLGIDERLEDQRLPDASRWGQLPSGTKTKRGDALFPRLDD
jgi:methionyl-tRNA synthetase